MEVFYRIYDTKNNRFVSSRASDIYYRLESVNRALSYYTRRSKGCKSDYVIFKYELPTSAVLMKPDGSTKEVDEKVARVLYTNRGKNE